METANSVNDRQNVSFKFNKISKTKITRSALEEEKDFVLSVDKKEIKSSAVKLKEKELVIPLIKRNEKCSAIPTDGLSEAERDLNKAAISELVREAKENDTYRENNDCCTSLATVPLLMQNKILVGDEKEDLSLSTVESKLEDYDRIPVEQFGLAMLRGMGWKEGDGIGARNKQCVEPVLAHLRPKGLGLGADATMLKKNQKKASEEKLELVNGSCVKVVQGQHNGIYGQVLGLDEENARAIVKLANSEKVVTFPEFSICVVTKKEFDKESKIINRAAYENYKQETEKKEKSKRNGSQEEKSSKTQKIHRDSECGSSKNYDSKHQSVEKKKLLNKEEASIASKSWIRPQLRVRFIDDTYKNGRYFNKKMIVEDVLSSRRCSCRMEEGRYLDDISPSMLETVIPRGTSSYVMIVRGKHAGELCTVLEKDKSTCMATVQLLSDRDRALRVEYDSVCEYVGDVEQFD